LGELFAVERELFLAAKDEFLWCWEENDDGDRKLEGDERRMEFINRSRELGVIAFTQGIIDEVTECKYETIR